MNLGGLPESVDMDRMLPVVTPIALEVAGNLIPLVEGEPKEQNMLSPERRGQERVYSPRDKVILKLILRGKRIGFSLAECRELIELYDPGHGNRKQLETFLDKITQRRAQLAQQLLDIEQMQIELDTAEERCRTALEQTQ